MLTQVSKGLGGSAASLVNYGCGIRHLNHWNGPKHINIPPGDLLRKANVILDEARMKRVEQVAVEIVNTYVTPVAGRGESVIQANVAAETIVKK